MSQGRALLNAIGNLELSGAYADALRKLGVSLEDVARQVRWLKITFQSFMVLYSRQLNYSWLCGVINQNFNI